MGIKSPAASSKGPPAFELRGTVSTLTVIRLLTHRIDEIDAELSLKIDQLPQFFQQAPVVVDLEALGEQAEQIAFVELAQLLRQHQLVPVAVRNAGVEQQRAAFEAGLGLLKGSPPRASIPAPSPADDQHDTTAAAQAATDQTSAPSVSEVAAPARAGGDEVGVEDGGMIVKQPVRGGQIVYAQQRDLVMLASVNAGGEVIADGNIHVYAALRGRALAGAHGNQKARIFCTSLDAELVSVAGHYLRAEEIPAECRGKPMQVFLQAGQIIVRPM